MVSTRPPPSCWPPSSIRVSSQQPAHPAGTAQTGGLRVPEGRDPQAVPLSPLRSGLPPGEGTGRRQARPGSLPASPAGLAPGGYYPTAHHAGLRPADAVAAGSPYPWLPMEAIGSRQAGSSGSSSPSRLLLIPYASLETPLSGAPTKTAIWRDYMALSRRAAPSCLRGRLSWERRARSLRSCVSSARRPNCWLLWPRDPGHLFPPKLQAQHAPPSRHMAMW